MLVLLVILLKIKLYARINIFKVIPTGMYNCNSEALKLCFK